MWYTEGNGYHNAFVCEGKFDSMVRLSDASFNSGDEIEYNFLIVGEDGGVGTMDACLFNSDKVSDRDVSAQYLLNPAIK